MMNRCDCSIPEDLFSVLARRVIDDDTSLTNWPTSSYETGSSGLDDLVCRLRSQLSSLGYFRVTFPLHSVHNHTLTVMAWNLLTLFVVPIPQYKSGEVIYDVIVKDAALGPNHYSGSNLAGDYHTDGSLLGRVPDVAALLALQPADSGGETVLISAKAICDHLTSLNPGYIAELQREHPFDVMGQHDFVNVKQQSILRVEAGQCRVCYLRRYVESGYSLLNKPIPAILTSALDALDAFASSPKNQTAFLLQRGEMLVWANSSFLHGRQPFTCLIQQRHLRRMYGVYPNSTAVRQ